MLPRVIFLQLPQLDIEINGPQENIHLAAAYLRHAAAGAGLNHTFQFAAAAPEWEMLDDHHCADALLRAHPAIIAATIYLWNVERTLRVLHLVKTRQPTVKIAVGGPEAAVDHPFIFKARHLDVICVGEGETVFPSILRFFRGGKAPDYTTVFSKKGRRFIAGHTPPPPVDLNRDLPPADDSFSRPDRIGMAYLETIRGCPLRCAYCRYPHLRSTMSFLTPPRVIRRIALLRACGAREIRIIDPTFNARPDFDGLLERIAEENDKNKIAFFAELRAETLTARQADLLARANFTGIEIGLQSRDPRVLRMIHRSTDLAALARGVHLLANRGIKTTVDVMYGLPGQDIRDVKQALRWATGIRRVNPQCMQTLLLPGTELRARSATLHLRAAELPPYGVTSTDAMKPETMREIELFLDRDQRLRSDCRTSRFIGRRLPDLFHEQISFHLVYRNRSNGIPGRTNRRALILAGSGPLFEQRNSLVELIHQAIEDEPNILWQFVLAPTTEEPLDLLDLLIAAILRHPAHLVDRYAGATAIGVIASRRILIQLPPHHRFSATWIAAVEHLLSTYFL